MTKLFLKGNDEHIIKATGFLWEEDRRIKGRRVQKLGSGFIVFFILCALNSYVISLCVLSIA